LGELGINLPSLLAQLVNFGILLGILYLVAYKPIMKMLDERSNRIKESMEQTEVIKDKAEKAEEEIAKQLKEAGRQSQAVIDRGVRTGEEMRQKAQEEAKKEAEALLARARNEIRRERDGVIDDLRREFADLTILAAGKVIDRTLDREAHRQLIDKVLEEGTELKKGG
jgi:F-type H+-transporting ATPase subunit b